jgi:hypothetical protein
VPRPLGFGRGTGLVLLDGDSRLMIDAEHEHLELAERSRRGDDPVLVLVRGARARVIHDRREIAELVALLDAQARWAAGQAAVAEQAARRAEEIASESAREAERRARELERELEERVRRLLTPIEERTP